MLRSLFSSISGLRSHQTRMDVIGNNIANVNTTGFKSSRVTFEESMSQMIAGSSRPGDQKGGTNPVQVGLGMSVGSIDTKFTQGNLEATGQITDMAIEGNAFFGVSNGEGTFYTRNGAFQIDAKGQMVLPTNGFVLQGKLAQGGVISPGSIIENVVLPLNQQSPAKGTEEINFSRNLDSDSAAKGSILYSQKFLHQAEGGDGIQGLHDGSGRNLGILPSDTLQFSGQTALGVTKAIAFQVSETTTLNDIANAIQTFMVDTVDGLGLPLGSTASVATIAQDVNAVPPTKNRGALRISPAGNLQNFQVTSNRPISSSAVAKAFAIPSTVAGGTTAFTDTLRGTAQSTDRIAELFDSNGRALGLEDGDSLSYFGELGGQGTSGVTPSVMATGTPSNPGGTPPTVTSGTTLQNILDKVKDNFKLPDTDGTPDANPSISINAAGSNDNIPDGSIVIRGQPETSFAIRNLTINSTDTNNSKPSPLVFNANMAFTTLQQARDTGTYETSIVTYDEAGDDHTVSLKFIHSGTPNSWLWEASMGGQEEILEGQKGRITFAQDGSVSSFIFDGGDTELVVDPKNGSSAMRMALNVGGPSDFTGLTQFRSPTTAAAVGQDGYAMGRLAQISVDPHGVINGTFTNGTNLALAQIMVADFSNPAGLQKLSDSIFSVSSNSGDPIFGIPGEQSASTLRPGALELSNVELAQEFTDMITTQRGYQANARVITVSDSLLEELVALKR